MAPYKISNTEQNNNKASEFETKSLLFLIGYYKDREKIKLLIIDAFNDVTGGNIDLSELWDVQSKNHGVLNPKKIGRILVTLYKNFCSDIDFNEYILFVPEISEDYLISGDDKVYGISNFNEDTLKRIKAGLLDEVNKGKNDDDKIEVSDLIEFLNTAIIVEDRAEPSEQYVKSITKFRGNNLKDDAFYRSIFEEIRDRQTAIKNSYIEGIEINYPIDILAHKRHITSDDIQTLVINRVIGSDLFDFNSIPIPFLSEIRNMDPQDIEDILLECNSNLSKAFFDKNGNREFWQISEILITKCEADNNASIRDILNELKAVMDIKSIYLTDQSILFLIALIKQGLKR